MGVYEEEFWDSDGIGHTRLERSSGVYRSYLPSRLMDFDLPLYQDVAASVYEAQDAIRELNSASEFLTDAEPLARLILRSEAMASSRIEGLEISAQKLLETETLMEIGVEPYRNGNAAAVLGNVDAMSMAIEDEALKETIGIEDICDIHRKLMASAGEEEIAGEIRTQQNWIGGNRMNPLGAAYVPPSPSHVPALMDDLVEYMNKPGENPFVRAAVVHAQFETIHPFADGNGRCGRTLVHLVLKRDGLADRIVPPMSLVLSTDNDNYRSNLEQYRYAGDSRTSAIDAMNGWVEYFAHITVEACDRAFEFEDRIREIQREWRQTIPVREKSAASLLMDKMPGHPVISIETAAKLIGRTYQATRLAVNRMQEAGILVQNSNNRKSRIFVAQDAVDAFTYYERALATPSGDTSIEKPVRNVPQRPRTLTPPPQCPAQAPKTGKDRTTATKSAGAQNRALRNGRPKGSPLR